MSVGKACGGRARGGGGGARAGARGGVSVLPVDDQVWTISAKATALVATTCHPHHTPPGGERQPGLQGGHEVVLPLRGDVWGAPTASGGVPLQFQRDSGPWHTERK